MSNAFINTLSPPAATMVLLLTACGSGNATGDQRLFTSRDSAGIVIVEYSAEAFNMKAPFELADAPAFRLGTIDGPPESQFTRIRGGLRLDDGTFAILDRDANEVRLFDNHGTFLHSFGGAGDGPGEFRSAMYLVPGPDQTLLVWDSQKAELSTFRASGDYLETISFGSIRAISALLPLKNGEVLGVLEETPRATIGHMQNIARIVRLQADRKIDQLATFAGTEWELRQQGSGVEIIRRWYYPQLHIATTPAGFWISYGTGWELLRRGTDDGGIDRIVRFDRQLEPFSRSRVRELQEAQLAAASTPERRTRIRQLHEDEQYPDYIPPIWELFADAVGRIWVAPTDFPGTNLPMGLGRAASQWLILDQQGLEVVGTITLPESRRPLYADEDGVLVVTADEMHVPYVEWWPFGVGPGSRVRS